MYGNGCCHLIITKNNMMEYTDSNTISMILSILLLNGHATPKYVKYMNWNMNSNMTASIPSFCPKDIVNAVNMYFLIKLTDKNALDMFFLIRTHSLLNINIILWLTCYCLKWCHWIIHHWNIELITLDIF